MASMSYLNTGPLLQLNAVDVSVEDLEEALVPVEDEGEAIGLLRILYPDHLGYV